ncbi:hypothetical protein [Marinomonas polaris]|uniref:hypothetical protein n=1 Tax=Marinomonas polaris TaxID=293552 RepID=UPI003F9E61B7
MAAVFNELCVYEQRQITLRSSCPTLQVRVFMFSSEEQSERQERGQTIVSSGGICFDPSAITPP